MKFPLRPGLTGLALMAALQTTPALAANSCWVRPQDGAMTYPLEMGTVYVPRDAKVGSVIGMFDQPFTKESIEGRYVSCENDGTATLTVMMKPVAPLFATPLPPVQGEDVTGKVFETGIAGIGAMIKLRHPFDGLAPDAFRPLGRPVVPFTAQLRAQVNPLRVIPLLGNVTLIKTGPIQPGPQSVNTSLFYAQFNLVPRAIDVQISATVMQAQCDSAVVSDDPVDLGAWRITDFGGPGSGSTAKPFSIRLGNCEADPGDVNIAWANLRLDGASGSQPIPGVPGAFTLTSDSVAAGVGIQILRGDAQTPVPLGRDVPLMAVTPGNTVLDLSARYYQTGDSRDIVPGLAKGALSFTVSFQ